MNENNEYNSTNVRPYKATGNLNTAIGNPTVNINDAMNINIKSATTTVPETNNIVSQLNNIQPSIPVNNIETDNNLPDKSIPLQQNNPQSATISVNNAETVNNVPNNNIVNNTNENNNHVKKTYVSATDNKPKKKNISFNMGPEFRIGLLIIFILLVFVFLLPMLSEIIMG